MNSFRKNMFIVYSVYTLHALALAWAVIHVLYYLANQLNYTHIGILFLIGAITELIAEIPSGAFSDIHGRKKTLYLTFAFFTISSILFFIGGSFWIFALAAIGIGLGGAFLSGTIDALLYETLKKEKKENKFKKYLSINHFLFIAVGVLTNFAIPILFKIQSNIPYLIGAICALAALPIISMIEKETLTKKSKNNIWKTYGKQITSGFKIIKQKSILKWIVLFAGVWSLGMGLFGDLVNQPYVAEVFGLGIYGIIFASATIVQSILVVFTDKIFKGNNTTKQFSTLILLWPIALTLLLINNIIVFILAMGVAWSIGTFRYVLVQNTIQQHVKKDNQRATVASINNMFKTAVVIVALPVFGYLMDIITLQQSVLVLAITSFIIGTIFILIKVIKKIN